MPTPIVVSPIVANLLASSTASALRAVTDAASAAQGAKADSALQPGDAMPPVFSSLPDTSSFANGTVILAAIDNVLSAWQNNSGSWNQIL